MGLYMLEVTILSAHDLKNVKLLGGTMDPYCVAWLYPHKVSSPVSKGGGVHPTWNALMTFIIDATLLEQGDAAITVEIFDHGIFSNKLIGTTSIPLRDVQGTSKASTGLSKASAYQVRNKSGKLQGVINIAMKASKALLNEKVAPPNMGMPAIVAAGQYEQQQQQKPRRGGWFGCACAGLLTEVLLEGGDCGGGCGGGWGGGWGGGSGCCGGGGCGGGSC